MLQAGILSGIMGTEFPGVGTIYLSQTLKFRKPVFIGDVISFRLKVIELNQRRNRARLETVCFNQNGETVVSGEALVMPPMRS
jgi:3-hydroxybutyryl-CoA dehydratase